MPRGKPFQPGQSGNPNGRPPKNRAWTAILEQAGSKTIKTPEGKQVARKRLMAELVMQAVSEGKVNLPNGEILTAEFKEWADFVKWVYNHIDGPPKQQLEIGGDVDNPIYHKWVVMPPKEE